MKKRKRFSVSAHEGISDEGFINLTPLIDVVFVVLIAFILIAPLLEVDHVHLAPATVSSENHMTGKRPLMIYVKEDNSIWFGQRLVTEKELLTLLKEKKKNYPYEVPQIFHDQQATFGTYQAVKGCVEDAGYQQMDVILKHK